MFKELIKKAMDQNSKVLLAKVGVNISTNVT